MMFGLVELVCCHENQPRVWNIEESALRDARRRLRRKEDSGSQTCGVDGTTTAVYGTTTAVGGTTTAVYGTTNTDAGLGEGMLKGDSKI